jgi:pimeloyl-ACP methyl ester carboxylesterase
MLRRRIIQSAMNCMLLSLPFIFTACSAGPNNPSFPVTFSEASQAVAQMRSDPRPLPRPLVIIGGFWDPNVSPPLFKNWFKGVTSDGQIITISVGLCGSFEECRRRVIEAVDAACPTADPDFTAEVDVVGASLGGLVARHAAAPSDDPTHPRRLRIARLFTISTPHSGARLAQLVSLTDYHRDMRPNSLFLQRLAAFDAAVTYELYPYVRLSDEIVGARHAAPPGKQPFWLPNPPLKIPHLGAMMDVRILADIARRLRGETPFTHFPPTPLPPMASR